MLKLETAGQRGKNTHGGFPVEIANVRARTVGTTRSLSPACFGAPYGSGFTIEVGDNFAARDASTFVLLEPGFRFVYRFAFRVGFGFIVDGEHSRWRVKQDPT